MIAFLVAIATSTSGPAPESRRMADFGRETLNAIRRDYYMPESKLYADAFEPGRPLAQPAFNWGVGVLLSALNAATRVDRRYEPWLREFADRTEVYWNPTGPVPGFDVLPAPKPVDRYYDDNAWMVMALVETSQVLRDPKYLDQAERALRFVLSGEDEKLGGGLYWKETEKTTKNTCANGPGVAATLAVYELRPKPELLSKAKEIYAWTKRTLQDPADGLFWDAIALDGSIGKYEWSYNTALMIRSATELYEITKEPGYADDARRMIRASRGKWLGENPPALKDEGRFAHLLYESWIRAARAGFDAPTGAAPLVTLHDRFANSSERYPKRWNTRVPVDARRFELIDQASAARAFFVAAESAR